MCSKPIAFIFVSNEHSNNINHQRQQVVYDDDIFGENTVDNSIINNNIPTSNQKSITVQKGSTLPKRSVRQQPYQIYRRLYKSPTTNIAVKANGVRANGAAGVYTLKKRIGHGTYGEVFEAFNLQTRQKVAVKRLLSNPKTESDWHHVSREIEMLKMTRECKNVVQLLEVRNQRTSLQQHQLHLIFEYCPYELQRIMSNKRILFTLADIKALMFQLFAGLTFIHRKKILHRDIKTENILLTADGVLKIADFGLSRAITENHDKRIYTVNVVTLWYRAPELLFGDTGYSTSVDLWSAGCVMAEFWTRTPIMQGNSEREQIEMISRMCGAIDPNVWPDVIKLSLFQTLRLTTNGYQCNAKDFLFKRSNNNDGSDLFKLLLTLDPKKRISAFLAQNHDFFWFDPLPSNLEQLMNNIRNFMR